MRLKSLDIAGFKSFAKKSELSFHTPITAIVGPNGSGKSNVAEAFRFALGEQSVKSLRGKKGEDLIFNGSNKASQMNRAAVKLTLDNSHREFGIDFDEVTLERVVHRDGINEYFLNGSQVRLKDIVELLAQAHIGATGHHIISQGEADRILTANPRERREMIEDALGLKSYIYKRTESEKKLAKTRENIEKVESLRRELAPHLRFLRKQMEKIEKAKQVQSDLRGLYIEYLAREEHYIVGEKRALSARRAGPAEALAGVERELSTLRAQIAEARARAEGEAAGGQGRSSELLALESRISGARAAKDALYRDIGRLEGEIDMVHRSIRRMEDAAKLEEGRMVPLKEVRAIAEEIEREVGNGGSAGNTAGAESAQEISIENIRAAFARITTKLRDLINRHTSAPNQAELASLNTEKTSLAERRAAIEVKLKAAEAEERALAAEYAALKNSIEKEKEGSLQAEKAILELMNRQTGLSAELATVRAAEERLAIEERDFRNEVNEAVVLIGRDIYTYREIVLPAAPTAPVDASQAAAGPEPRQAQVDRKRTIEKLKIRLEEMGVGGVDEVVKEFRESEERDTFLGREIEDLIKAAADLETLISDLTKRLNDEFEQGIVKINVQFEAFFSLMFGGGAANLVLVKEERKKRRDLGLVSALLGDDVLDGADGGGSSGSTDGSDSDDDTDENGEKKEVPPGIDINVSLPHKRIKGLTMLSGGERALTSIALLFAMSQVNPPPFIILDETDAALDEANSRRYGDMIENLAKYSQLILITHNRETMSRAGVLYGVTMGSDGISKLLSIQFEEAVKVAK